MHRIAWNQTTHISNEIPNIIDKENIDEPVHGKTPVLILSNWFFEEKDSPIFFVKVNLALMHFQWFQ